MEDKKMIRLSGEEDDYIDVGGVCWKWNTSLEKWQGGQRFVPSEDMARDVHSRMKQAVDAARDVEIATSKADEMETALSGALIELRRSAEGIEKAIEIVEEAL